MRFIEYLKRAFIVRKCVICDGPIDYNRSVAICDDCQKYWISVLDILCDKCGYESEYCICENKALSKSVDFFTFVMFYKKDSSNPTNGIVYKLKRDYNSEVLDFCSESMKKRAVKIFAKHNIPINDFYVTFPPRREKGIIKFGYDHAKLLSEYFARKIGAKTMSCFENTGGKEQKTLDKKERFANAKESYKILENANVKDKNFIIIDDVLTSGATIGACASILRDNGAKRVVAVCFAKDI